MSRTNHETKHENVYKFYKLRTIFKDMQRISIKYMYTNPPNSKYFKVLYGRRRTRQMMTGPLHDNKQRCQTSQQQANKENKMRRTAAKKNTKWKMAQKKMTTKKSGFSWDLSINQGCLPKRSDQMISNVHTHTHSRMFVCVCVDVWGALVGNSHT